MTHRRKKCRKKNSLFQYGGDKEIIILILIKNRLHFQKNHYEPKLLLRNYGWRNWRAFLAYEQNRNS